MLTPTTPTIVSGTYAGDSDTRITVPFTVGPDTGAMCSTKQGVTTCDVAIWFGAHVAAQADWGAGTGAGNIPGSPYHVALAAVDGESAGQRDNQMQTGAITSPFNLIIVKNTVGGNDTFGYTVTGDGLNDFSLRPLRAPTLRRSPNLTPGTAIAL